MGENRDNGIACLYQLDGIFNELYPIIAQSTNATASSPHGTLYSFRSPAKSYIVGGGRANGLYMAMGDYIKPPWKSWTMMVYTRDLRFGSSAGNTSNARTLQESGTVYATTVNFLNFARSEQAYLYKLFGGVCLPERLRIPQRDR